MGRGKELETVQAIVSYLLFFRHRAGNSPKRITDNVSGNLEKQGHKVGTRSIQKGIAMLRDAGILDASNESYFLFDRKGLHARTMLDINMGRVREKMNELWIEEYRKGMRSLPEDIQKKLVESSKADLLRYSLSELSDEKYLVDEMTKRFPGEEFDAILDYLHNEEVNQVMQFLKLWNR